METSSVSVKGQIVIPSKIRRRFGIKKGTKICFQERGGEIVLKPITDEYIDSIKGMLAGRGDALKALREEKRREREL